MAYWRKARTSVWAMIHAKIRNRCMGPGQGFAAVMSCLHSTSCAAMDRCLLLLSAAAETLRRLGVGWPEDLPTVARRPWEESKRRRRNVSSAATI
jgi:hypothetical protein